MADKVQVEIPEGKVVLEPMAKVLCACQRIDGRTRRPTECLCKRVPAGSLKQSRGD